MEVSKIKEILKQNKIRGWAHLNKPELIELLKKHDLLPVEQLKPKKSKSKSKSIKISDDPKMQKLYEARNNPMVVILKNIENEEEISFPSIYKAARFIGKVSSTIHYWNNRVYKNKYAIKITRPA